MSAINTTIKSLITAAIATVAVPALAAFVPLTIQESGIPGAVSNQFVADQLSGQYDEIFSVTGLTGPTTGTFNTLALFNAGQWFDNGSALSTQLNAFGAAGYGLYAKFQSDGSFSAGPGGDSFTGGNGTIQLWADPNHDTSGALPGTAAGKTIADISMTNSADDLLLGYATLLSAGAGHAQPGLANGDFELIFVDWQLQAPDGTNYFVAPRPFYTVIDLNGNFQSFDPTSATDTALLRNSANAFFNIPEPATLGLLGLSLVGLGFSRRRKI